MLHRENQIKTNHTISAADLLKEFMEYYHIPQNDLAERIGVTSLDIDDLLTRKQYLTAVLALRIERVMGISAELLLSLDTNFRLQQAQDSPEVTKNPTGSPRFLQRYDWMTV